MDVTHDVPPELEELDTEYRYVVHVKAMEAFANRMRREAVVVPDGSSHISFATSRRLDMKHFKEDGLIWSYSIIKVRRDEDVIEEG
jgi:hypothetical protein